MTGIPNASSPSTPGAGSGDLFWFGDPAFQLSGRKQSIGLDHVLFAMHPLGLDGIEPGTLGWQQAREDANAFAALFDLLIMGVQPGANPLTAIANKSRVHSEVGSS